MPEGPEVYLLAWHVKRLGVDCFSKGKHLFVRSGEKEFRDLSFGLHGRVFWRPDERTLVKLEGGTVNGGDVVVGEEEAGKKLGPDFMNMSIVEFETLVRKWQRSQRCLASLMINQAEIAGLGVAWISEICFDAGVDLSKKAKDLDLKSLPESMLKIQNYVKDELFSKFVDVDSATFVNNWFRNIYAARTMKAYKKTSAVTVNARQFWK